MKSRWFPAGLLLVLLSSLVVMSCSKDSDDEPGGNNNPNPGTSTNTVTMSNMAFSPSRLTVKAGTTVTWVNESSVSHTVTANDGSFSSGTLRQGENFKHTFTTVGTFPYHCNLHTGMNATVVVE